MPRRSFSILSPGLYLLGSDSIATAVPDHLTLRRSPD